MYAVGRGGGAKLSKCIRVEYIVHSVCNLGDNIRFSLLISDDGAC